MAYLSAVSIQRADHKDAAILDTQFAIDVALMVPSGMILLGQEKFLSRQYASFKSVTIEYEQNQYTHEGGDWYKLACQFYFVGYENGSGFDPWIILNWPAVVMATNAGAITWTPNANKNGHARASFMYAPMRAFPDSCVIARSSALIQAAARRAE
jgi:hypothetical protein